MRIIGWLLILLGIALCIIAPIGYYYLLALGCAMNTTGCRNFSIEWGPAIMFVGPLLLIAAAFIWGGRRLVRRAPPPRP